MKSHHDCKRCGKIFTGFNAKRSLTNHMKTHEIKPVAIVTTKQKIKPKCDLCGQEFAYKSYLDKHYVNCVKKHNILKKHGIKK